MNRTQAITDVMTAAGRMGYKVRCVADSVQLVYNGKVKHTFTALEELARFMARL